MSSWTPRAAPSLDAAEGAFVRIEHFDRRRHAEALFAGLCGEEDHGFWRYIPDRRPNDAADLAAQFKAFETNRNWRVMALQSRRDPFGVGVAAYMRIRPEHGSVEVGSIILSRALQRTAAATEAMCLMARHAFEDLGYRRYEWKCDARNAPSRAAALRLGFVYEGTFRNDMVVRGENRDTAWFSITDAEWPRVKAGFEAWLAPENFDDQGEQRRSLAACRRDAP